MSDRWPLAQLRYTRQLWWRAWSWLRGHVIGDDPDPQYSQLDREDGLS